MKKHEADTTMNRLGWRDYELDIIIGELYEVWLQHDWEEPKPCVTVIQIATDAISPNWEVLVNEQVKEVHGSQIFKSGTATRPNPPITMPTMKRVWPSLIANDIVSVQPMTLPSGLLFYLDYTLGEEKKYDE
jgi:hypothetical protein